MSRTETEIVWVVVASGVVALAIKLRRIPTPPASLGVIPPFLLTGIHGPASSDTLWNVTWFFTTAGAFVFGSGLAIVPFMYGGVVENFGWLNDRQFLDAVAIAMITPGPVVITVAFVGYLVAGPIGAVVAALATFVPCYLFTILPAVLPEVVAQRVAQGVRRRRDRRGDRCDRGCGVRAGPPRTDRYPDRGDRRRTLLVLFRFKKIPEPLVILAAGAVGYVIVAATGQGP